MKPKQWKEIKELVGVCTSFIEDGHKLTYGGDFIEYVFVNKTNIIFDFKVGKSLQIESGADYLQTFELISGVNVFGKPRTIADYLAEPKLTNPL